MKNGKYGNQQNYEKVINDMDFHNKDITTIKTVTDNIGGTYTSLYRLLGK